MAAKPFRMAACTALLALLPLAVTIYLFVLRPDPAAAVIFVVDSTGDQSDLVPGNGLCLTGAGTCTLRAAIEEANALAGTDNIHFNIPGVGPHTIMPSTPLPSITGPVVIDGYTQPGSSANTNGTNLGLNTVLKIVLSGASAPTGSEGLRIAGGGSTVRGLVVSGFLGIGGYGVSLQSASNAIQGNFIGTDVSGTGAVPNGQGIVVVSASNLIGGDQPSQRNLLSGSTDLQVDLNVGSNGSQVKGNLIGTDISGTASVAACAGNYIGVAVAGGTADVVGGTLASSRNVISATCQGINIGAASAGAVVQGNYIGTDVSGMLDIGNSLDGVFFDQASGATIGGTAPGAGNVISGNNSNGLRIQSFGLGTGNVVQGNLIGTAADGVTALPNSGPGVLITRNTTGATSNSVGGTPSGAANTIAFNGGSGVVVSLATQNMIRANSIYSNAGMGIDNQSGGNTELPPPVISSLSPLSGTACAGCTVDIYSDAADQGRIYEGSTTASGAGCWAFGGSVTGPNVNVTATDGAGNTSEFSSGPLGPACESATPTPTPAPTQTPAPTATPTATPASTPTATPPSVGGIVEILVPQPNSADHQQADDPGTFPAGLALGVASLGACLGASVWYVRRRRSRV